MLWLHTLSFRWIICSKLSFRPLKPQNCLNTNIYLYYLSFISIQGVVFEQTDIDSLRIKKCFSFVKKTKLFCTLNDAKNEILFCIKCGKNNFWKNKFRSSGWEWTEMIMRIFIKCPNLIKKNIYLYSNNFEVFKI